jgi:hypothetical protein
VSDARDADDEGDETMRRIRVLLSNTPEIQTDSDALQHAQGILAALDAGRVAVARALSDEGAVLVLEIPSKLVQSCQAILESDDMVTSYSVRS